MLQADNVRVDYKPGPDRARLKPRPTDSGPGLHGVSLTVPTGSLFGILGPNGSGKTTLLRVLAGILRPHEGRVVLDNADIHNMTRRAIARRVAVVPQETHLAFDYSVLEIALMGRYPHLGNFGLEGPQDVRIACEALAATGTLELAGRSFDTLSGGEKQRVVIASALAQSPEIMLLDEPTASLDLGYQIEIGELLHALNREHGVTIVVATHDLNFAAGVCSHLALLKQGQVMATGPTEQVLTREMILRLYGVDADVGRHPATGRVVVVPIGKAS